jgi:S1-C subfamily serine protease
MVRRILVGLTCAATVYTSAGVPLWADTLKLKDGTHLDGKVMDEGTSYWVKGSDGQTHTIPKDSVQDWVRSNAPANPAAASASPLTGRGQAASVPTGASFAAVKAKADKVDTPIQAVALWQTYLDDAHPSATEAAGAKQQLTYWKQMVDGHAERINGKWIWGAERTKLVKQVRDMVRKARKDIDSNQTIQGIQELEQAVKLYPNDFDANFELGFFNLDQGAMSRSNAKIDAGAKSMEMAVHLRPTCAAAVSDLAIAYHFQKKYAVSVETAFRAAKIEDTKEIVQNLVNTITQAPDGLRKSDRLKSTIQQAMILAAKYGMSGNAEDNWEWVRPDETPTVKKDDNGGSDDDDSADKGPPGIIGNGTGELISADGYILTNRHVAKEGDYLMVRLSDGTLKVADRVVVEDDPDMDMAVIKIKTNEAMPFVRLAAYDHPPVGEDADVFGFPLLGLVTSVNASVKMTRGIVTAYDENVAECDVTIDAQINPGNSGGPIVDHFGNLLAIATAKTFAGTVGENAPISSYGLGQSSGRLRKFFAKEAAKLTGLKLEPGTTDKQLTNEELATKLTPVTVCVFICRGAPPNGEKSPARAPAQP